MTNIAEFAHALGGSSTGLGEWIADCPCCHKHELMLSSHEGKRRLGCRTGCAHKDILAALLARGLIGENAAWFDTIFVGDFNRRPSKIKNASAFLGEYEPIAYTIEGIVRSGSLYTLTGATGSGKTAFNIAAALAVCTGRSDILGREVERGHVVYVAIENPDDLRMKLLTAAYRLNVDLDRDLGTRLHIIDQKLAPKELIFEIKKAMTSTLKSVLIDTLAAMFDGDNINDPVQGGEFIRSLRPLTQLQGKPSVIVAAHPTKNAGDDQLVPYGAGAILNEVDGNLTVTRRGQSMSLHWQGKLRGLEFDPLPFSFLRSRCPNVIDAKGREIGLPCLIPSTAEAIKDDEHAKADLDRMLITTMIADPAGGQRGWALKIGRSQSSVNSRLQRLKREKLVELILGRWRVTSKGEKAVADVS